MFEKTFELNPKLTNLRFDYANLLGNMGKNEEAIAQYKTYLTAYPEDANAYRNLGIVYKKLDNNELALLNLEKSYSKDSTSLETQKELAYCYHKKKDYVNALKFYNFALKSEPKNQDLLANKALTLHAMNNYVAAIEIYKELLAQKPNERIEKNMASASIAYGYNLYDKKDYGQAILYFEDAINLNDKEASAFFGYAMANQKMGCTDLALASYEKALELAPENIEYKTALDTFRNEYKASLEADLQDDIEEMKKDEEQIEEPVFQIIPPIATVEPTPETTQQQSQDETLAFLVKKGDESYKNQKFDEAISFYTKAVVFNPSDKLIMLKLANIYKLQGNNEKAMSFYDKIIALDSNCKEAYFNKGLVFANDKNYDEAIKCFEKVVEIAPDYHYAYYSLALTYELKDMPQKAIEYYCLYTGLESDKKMIEIVNDKIKQLEDKE